MLRWWCCCYERRNLLSKLTIEGEILNYICHEIAFDRRTHTKKKLACYQLRSLWQKVIWPVDKKKSIMDITVINADKKNHLKNHLKSLKVFIENEWSWCRLRIHTHKCKYQRIGRSANNQTKIKWTEIVEKQKTKIVEWIDRFACTH